jgi:hypothetical protein
MIFTHGLPTWCAVCLLMGLISCEGTGIVEPRLDIQVTKTGPGYDFSFKICDSWLRGGPFEVSDVLVVKGTGKPDSLPVQCEVTKENPSVRNLRGPWRYATPPPGFTMTNCEPLRPGDTYQVRAGAGASSGHRVFTVKENGDVVLGASSCR